MKQIKLMLALGSIALVMAACVGPKTSGTTEARESRDEPTWAHTRPIMAGMIYGVGQAKKQNPSLAKKVAAQRARDEVAAAVKIKVESLMKDFMQESGIGERAGALEFTQYVSKGVTDATLVGAIIKETYKGKDGTFFVLVEYSLEDAHRNAVESARQEENLWNEFKADKGFDALEAELAKLRNQ